MDLAALKAYLDGLGPHPTLAASDAHLPAPLQAVLASMPAHQIALGVGSDGVSVVGTTLTITGTTTDAWPVQGMTGVRVTLATATLVVQDVAPTPKVDAHLAGTLPIGASVAHVTLAPVGRPVVGSAAVAAGWQMGLDSATAGVTPEALVLLGAGDAPFPFPVPAALAVLGSDVSIAPGGFAVTFFPGTTFDTSYAVKLTDPSATWDVIPSILAFTGIDIAALVSIGTGAPASRSVSVTLTGHLIIDTVPVDVVVAMSASPTWLVTVLPGKGATAFPGLAALAGWLVGSEVAGDTVTGFGDVGFGVSGFDAAIERVTVAYDWKARSLHRLEIVSLLSLGALDLDVALMLPAIAVDGLLHGGPVAVAAVLSGLGLPNDGVPASLMISDVTFHAAPADGVYLASMTVGEAWPAGPVQLESLTVSLGRDPYDGVTAEVAATLAIGKTIEISLLGGYGGAAVGWKFAGNTGDVTTLDVGELITELAQAWGIPSVPAPVAGLSLRAVSLDYESAPGHFAFSCEADTTVTGTPISVVVSIDVHKTPPGPKGDGTIDGTKGYSATFAGRVTVASLEFDLVFDIENTGTNIFVATFTSTGDATTVSLATLVADLSPGAAKLVPADLSIDLKDVKLAVVKPDATPATFAFGLDLSTTPLDLSKLPVVGDKLPPGEALTIHNLQVVYSNLPLDKDATATVNKLFPAKVVPFPQDGLVGGPGLTAAIQIGADTENIAVGVPTAPQAPPQLAAATSVPAVGAGDGGAASAPASYWIDVQRQLGVIQIARIGLLYQSNSLLVGFDGTITVGPVAFSLQGLAVGSSLAKFSPAFGLDGLGLAYASGPLTIQGALLRVPGPDLAPDVKFQFDGYAVVEAETFGLAAIGSYAQLVDGQPSLFVFAQLETPLGGPPAFFVTGLMAGFGFNRALTIPPVDQVAGFPLVALGTPPTPGQQVPPQTPTHILDVLEGRAPIPPSQTPVRWIAPAPGRYWIAIGLEFTSFEVVRTRALLVVEFGDEFELALLGTSTLQLPQPDESAETYAYVELGIEAVFAPAKGFFGLSAELAPASYVLTQACHLTGGFAFYIWFSPSPNAGQFVVTLGGYHPAFRPLPYFPVVPRLGFNWKVSDEVSITGSAYFALTTSCVMAGAALDVEFSSGNLGAWFKANADMLVSWRPFFFTVQIGVSIGVSYRLSLFGIQKTISLSLSATVDLWGPPTGGRVLVHLWIISFTVAFGSSGASTATDPLGWSEFAGLLPPADHAVTVLSVTGVAKMQDTQDTKNSTSGKLWYARAVGLAFSTQSSVPASQLSYGKLGEPHAADVGGETLAIRPMNLTGVTAVHEVVLRPGSPTAAPLDVSAWTLAPRRQNVPESLWGAPPTPFSQVPAKPGADVVPGALVGYDISVPEPALGPTPGVVPIDEYAEEPLPPGTHPLDPHATPSTDYVPVVDPTSVAAIAGVAAAKATRTTLIGVLAAAGCYAGADGALDHLAASAGHAFSDAPMLEHTP